MKIQLTDTKVYDSGAPVESWPSVKTLTPKQKKQAKLAKSIIKTAENIVKECSQQ